jgi:hypothetical protein
LLVAAFVSASSDAGEVAWGRCDPDAIASSAEFAGGRWFHIFESRSHQELTVPIPLRRLGGPSSSIDIFHASPGRVIDVRGTRAISGRIFMAKRSFVQRTQRTIVGTAKASAARIQRIASKAATAAATAAAEAAVAAAMKSLMGRGSPTRGRKAAAKRRARKTSRMKRR